MKKIAQITDLHIDDFLAIQSKVDARKHFENALTSARSRGISVAILTGDLGAPESTVWLFETILERDFEFFVVLGNHDNLADFQRFDFLQPLLKDDGLYYAMTLDGFECLFLDSSAEEIGAVQLKWLERQVGRSNDPLLVFVHHPILDCGGTIIDRLYPLKNRDAVRRVLVGSQRQISIFCGHYHYRTAYENREGNVHQFLTPSTLGQIKTQGEAIEPENDGYIAYREIQLADKELRTEVVEVK
ncbi:MAG TPA: metallophosphoesterase [Anaerolineales bacterium]|nr:metallophosphoesterase [Anaerolineales bacterium]